MGHYITIDRTHLIQTAQTAVSLRVAIIVYRFDFVEYVLSEFGCKFCNMGTPHWRIFQLL